MALPRPLSSREREILDALTLRVRLLSVAQLARTWWSGGVHAMAYARRFARELEHAGLVRRRVLLAHPEIVLSDPVTTWAPGESAPNFALVSRRLQSRWTEPSQRTPVVLATPAAANFLGGVSRPDPKRVENTHDLHLAAVFLLLARRHPEIVANWSSEALIHRSRPDAPGEKLPDAMVQENGRRRIVEFGGAYARQKLEAFHAFCVERALPYEIW